MPGMAGEADESGRLRRARAGIAARARRLDANPRLVLAAKLARELLPGDSRFGDPLSTAGHGRALLAGRRLSQLTAERPGVLRELGLSALQVWQGLSEAQGRGRGAEEVAIAFTDLAGFSAWTLRAGDDAALELLRDVGQAVEPPVRAHGGTVVKWLGDGMMAVFAQPQGALEAVLEACELVDALEADGYAPRLRAGIHVGRPRRLGGDYLGTDVNVAARVADAAAPGELLVSSRALQRLDTGELTVGAGRPSGLKGVPDDVIVHTIPTC
jgi:adenylate cyclase